MERFLNMRDTENRHIKAEKKAILSIGRGERIEILYTGEDTATRKAKTIQERFRGTGVLLQINTVGESVYVKRM